MFDDIYRGFSNLIEDFFGGFISNGSSWNSMGDFPLPCLMTWEIRSYRKSWKRGSPSLAGYAAIAKRLI
jgi:hypothetical protein